MENSGSYRFADHIYAGQASGRLGLGTLVDKALLSLPACRSFRNRYVHSRDRILEYVRTVRRDEYRILSAPCGLPRDLLEAALDLRKADPLLFGRIRFYGLDIDPAALAEARSMTSGHGFANFEFICADAFDSNAYPPSLDMVTSSGFAEFLEDRDLIRFYTACFAVLRKGGMLVSSATVRNRLSDYMLTNLAELLTHYRDEAALTQIFSRTPFGAIEMRRDAVGYQVLIAANK
ncbi:MAG: methyltransferase domain-containing protein [Acidobacteriia bacterium]|nr:methyltransferase domain-containing protein [Terriglobia bacterium]